LKGGLILRRFEVGQLYTLGLKKEKKKYSWELQSDWWFFFFC